MMLICRKLLFTSLVALALTGCKSRHENINLTKTINSTIPVTAVSFSPDGSMIAWTDYNSNEVHVYTYPNLDQVSILNSENLGVKTFAFSSGNEIIMGNYLPDITVWQIQPKKIVAKLKGHSKEINCVKIRNQILASCSHDREVIVWNLSSKEIVMRHSEHSGIVRALALSNSTDLLASGGNDKFLIVWDLNHKKFKRFSHDAIILALLFDEHGNVVIGDSEGKISVLNPSTGKTSYVKAHSGPISSMDMENGLLATGSWDGTAKIWDYGTNQLIGMVTHSDYVFSVSIHPSKKILASCGRDKSIKISQF